MPRITPTELSIRYMRGTMVLLLSIAILSAADCGGSGGSCTVADNGDGTATISCPDGTSTTVSSGQDGQDGQNGVSCSVADNGDGTKTISCTDGTSVTIDDGQDGDSTLVVNEVLQEGDPNCPVGGIAVHTGIDGDGNGLLEGDEITGTSYLCNGQDGNGTLPSGVLHGSYTIRNSIDAYLISLITEITGDLVVDAPGLADLSLPALAAVGGDLSIDNNAGLTSLYLTALTSVEGDLYIYNNVVLCNSLVIALLDQLIAAGWNGISNIHDNDDSC
ncbi:MAG TPA: hypothetical protein VM425_03715 [Myxococcota bacterium]|nr:hypothetical protein [Myxococcota bacterium]